MTRYVIDAVEITTEILPGGPNWEPGDPEWGPTATNYMAFANGDRRTWEVGRTEEEAIGKIVVSLALEGSRCA